MAKEKTTIRITRGLQEAVKSNTKIKEVYFGENGEHYFNKYKIKVHNTNEQNQTTEVLDVECLPGAKQGVVMIKTMANGGVVWKAARRNISYSPIVASLSREDILKAEPVSDIKTETEKLAILKAASEISKDADFEGLMKKLKTA